MRSLIHRMVHAVVVALACCSYTHADWPQFLGELRNGTSRETGLLDSFPDDGPEVVWRVPGGVGMSAVTVVNDFAITTFNEAGKQVLVAFDTESGDRVWQTELANEYGDVPFVVETRDGLSSKNVSDRV